MKRKSANLLLFLIAGALAGFLWIQVYRAGLTGFWRQTGALPEPPAAVEGVQKGYLYIRSEQGDQYAYLVDPAFSSGADYAWQPVSSRVVTDEGTPPAMKWKSLPLLQKARVLYEGQIIYNVEGTAYLKVAQAVDGSIWLWKVTRPWGESIITAWFLAPSLAAGFLAWALFSLAAGRRVEPTPAAW